jgi:hypothetical protein
MDCNRRVFVKGLGFVFLGVTPFLEACNHLSGEPQSKEKNMQTQPGRQPSSARPRSIPPIDAEAPSRLETATFALG